MRGVDIESVVNMGFTRLEAEIYIHLLQDSPATGYSIAKQIGRTNANTYKAIESLQAKGAILIDEAENRLCRAVPAEELLDQMERHFGARKRRALAELSRLRAAPQDDRIYQLTTPEQVYERCHTMLSECTCHAALDLFPEPMAQLKDAIAAAAARDINVVLQAYEPTQLPGATVTLHRDAAEVTAHWPAQWITVVTDGAQYLIAMLAPGGRSVHQAIWSASPILAWVFYSYACSDQVLSALMNKMAGGASLDELKAFLTEGDEPAHNRTMPGYQLLLDRFGWNRAPGTSRR